jgi:KAP family P-loop domain
MAAIGSSAIGETALGATPINAQQKNIEVAQINPVGLSDVPTEQDSIGFRPYTRAIAWFLSNEKTKPPLTISVEGPWGSGKSSFMLQLQKQLEAMDTGERKKYFIKFNAWRSDKDEALWAAFALTFIRQLEGEVSFLRRFCGNIELLWRRLDWRRGWLELAKISIAWVAFLSLSIYGILHIDGLKSLNVETVVVGIPWLGAAYLGLEKAKKIFGNPLSYDLSRHARDLKYDDKVAFIDRFQDDFADIIQSYVGKEGKIFVFIDDLDRCEVPRAAELLQAINLLLSADQGNLFFVLGLDREMVAAGIAAKNEKILQYLAAGRTATLNEKLNLNRIGIEYGYNFMEKFIQVPFRIPRPDEREISEWISELTKSSDTRDTSPNNVVPNQADSIEIRAGADPEQFDDTVNQLVRLFGFNPRRIKQFVNIFRLRVMIALSTKILTPYGGEAAGTPTAGGITIQQLGLFTAILMRWSELAGDLAEEPDLLDQLASPPNQPTTGRASKWATDDQLRKAINFAPAYSLADVNLRPLLSIMPDAYFGTLTESTPGQPRTRLIAGLMGNSIPSDANPKGEANTSPLFVSSIPSQQTGIATPRGPNGPTGATGPSGPSSV